MIALKGLVAITCLAVLAYVGYFFFGEWQAHQTRAARQAILDRAERCRLAERDLQRAKRGIDTADAEETLRLIVWSCRGEPKDTPPDRL